MKTIYEMNNGATLTIDRAHTTVFIEITLRGGKPVQATTNGEGANAIAAGLREIGKSA